MCFLEKEVKTVALKISEIRENMRANSLPLYLNERHIVKNLLHFGKSETLKKPDTGLKFQLNGSVCNNIFKKDYL